MLDRPSGAGSDRLKSMHLVLLAFKSSWRPWKECCMALKLIWRLVNTVSNEGPEVYRMVLSAYEVDQRITSSESDIIDVYREESAQELNPLKRGMTVASFQSMVISDDMKERLNRLV
jgi:hypothetical protein